MKSLDMMLLIRTLNGLNTSTRSSKRSAQYKEPQSEAATGSRRDFKETREAEARKESFAAPRASNR